MHYPESIPATDTNGYQIPTTPADDGHLPVALPPGFPAAPATAQATLWLSGHEVCVTLTDVDEARLLARMGGLLQAWCEGDEAHGEEEDEDDEDDMN